MLDRIGSVTEPIPLKRQARIGQAFSTTKPIETTKLTVQRIKDIVEVDKNKDKMIFTDGCGYVSRDLANKINGEYFL